MFHVRGLLLSFSFYRFLLIRKIRNTYFKVKLLSGVSKFLAIRRKNHLSFRHTNRLRRLSLNYDRNLNAATLDYLSLEFLLTHMFGQEGAVFAYDVPPLRVPEYEQFWRWILLTQGVEIKRLDYMAATVAKLDNSVYRRFLKYSKRNKKKTTHPRKKKLKKFVKFKESNYFALKTKNFYRNRNKLLKKNSYSSLRLVKINNTLVVSYFLRF